MLERCTQPLAFIVGMSRSGTKWLSMCLNQHPKVAVFGETGFWGKNYIQTEDGYWTPDQCRSVLNRMPGIRKKRRDEVGRLHVEGQATPVGASVGGLHGLFISLAEEILAGDKKISPRELFNRMCAVVSDESGKEHVIEKTPHHVNSIDRICSAYPRAKFVVMYREPYGFMRSYKHQGDRKAPEVSASYRKMYHPIGCALVYRGYAQTILRGKSEYLDKALFLPLASVKNDAEDTLCRVCDFLGVDYSDDCLLPPLNSSFPEQKEELEKVDVLWMNWLAGREMRKLGYTKKKSGASVSSLMKTLSEVPRWSLNVWKHLKTYQNASAARYIMNWLRK